MPKGPPVWSLSHSPPPFEKNVQKYTETLALADNIQQYILRVVRCPAVVNRI
jgi:hypothetical protein